MHIKLFTIFDHTYSINAPFVHSYMINAMFEELARNIQKSVTLSPEQLQAVTHYFIPKKLRKRQYIQNAGDASKYMVFVEKGLLRSFSVNESGHEHVMQFATEGWWIADMASFLSGDASIYNIEALEDSELLLMTKTSMDKLVNDVPLMDRYFRLLMQENIIALQRRLRVVQTHSAEETYLKFMEARPDLVTRAPQQYIALYLGITPETLSRVRKQVSERK